MSEAISRREFLSRRGLGEMLRKVTPILGIRADAAEPELPPPAATAVPASGAGGERTVMEGYLSSPLYSSALLSEMPWDMLIEEARRYGIAYEGRTKMDVVRELFVGAGGREEKLR